MLVVVTTTMRMMIDGDDGGDDGRGEKEEIKKIFHHPLFLNAGSLRHFYSHLRTTWSPKHFLIISFQVYLHSITFPIMYFH